MDVWVIENTGFPDDRFVWGVASSVDAAAEFMKKVYAAPYVVEWEEPKQADEEDDGYWELTGHFAAALGYSARPRNFSFTRYTIDQHDRKKTWTLTLGGRDGSEMP